MILIIGGAFQGKEAFARQLSGLMQQEYEIRKADGRTDAPDAAMHHLILIHFHEWIRRIMEEGGDPDVYTRQIMNAHPEIITMDEVGYGVVPIERAERDYREAVGRAGQALAASAEKVYRVVCGIPVQVK